MARQPPRLHGDQIESQHAVGMAPDGATGTIRRRAGSAPAGAAPSASSACSRSARALTSTNASRRAAPHDEIDLADRRPVAPREHLVAAQPEAPGGQPSPPSAPGESRRARVIPRRRARPPAGAPARGGRPRAAPGRWRRRRSAAAAAGDIVASTSSSAASSSASASAGAASRRGADHQHHLALGRPLARIGRGELGEAAAAHLLEALGQLARDRRRPRAERRASSASVAGSRRAASNSTSVAGTAPSSSIARAPRRAALRQEARHQEAVGRQAGDGQRGERRRRPRHREHLDPGRDRRAHQLVARIRDQRRAGIARQRDHGARPAAGRRSAGARAPRCARGRRAARARSHGGAAACRVTRVSSQTTTSAVAQHRERARREVAEIADRRGDQMQTRGEFTSLRSAARLPFDRRGGPR